jgi:prevent-host-death family protein
MSLRGPTLLITKLSSRKFDLDTNLAKKAAECGPVFITNRGRPTHVLLTFEEYRKMTEKRENILEMLAMPSAAKIEFEPPRLG